MRRGKQNGVRLQIAESPNDWENLCAEFADVTAFHRYDFLEAVAPSLRCKFLPLLVLSHGQKVGVAPMLVKQLGPFCTINWVPFPYLGPLVPTALMPATLCALTHEARRLRALNHQQSFSQVVVTNAVGGFTAHTDRTFTIPLSNRSDEDLMASMHSGRRREIVRAQREGFEICDARAEDFRLMGVWNSQVFAVQGLPPAYPAGTYERVFTALRNSPGSIFTVARINGRTVSVHAYFATGHRIFFWQSGTDPSYRSVDALVTWHELLRARDAGIREADFVGVPTEGIATYKRRFGAVERNYTVMHREFRSYRMTLRTLASLKHYDAAGASRS